MKLLYCTKDASEEAHVREKLSEWDIVFTDAKIADVPGDATFEALSIFVDSGKIDATVMDKFPNLKLIATRSTGYDHIDLVEAHKRSIVVCTVPAYGVHTVAEFAFALLLALSRRVPEAKERIHSATPFNQQDLTGFDLNGKTIGVVGTGSIGLHAVKIASGFGMRVLAYDVTQNEQVKNLGAQYVPLLELLAYSDVVTLHVPYLPHTHHLLNQDTFSKLKPGAYVINTARGAIIDTEALLEALDSGTVGGAGLDVLENETEITGATKKLLAHPRVIVTPHVAFDTKEAIQRILDITTQNLEAFRAGEPINTVAPTAA